MEIDFPTLVRRGHRQGYLRTRRKSSCPGLISHITQRATGSEPLFVEDADYLYMLKTVKDVAGEYGLTVFSFCLMTNHIHLLLRQNRNNLSSAMQSLFERYAIYFNRKYRRRGHLFCGPFRQSACYGRYYLLAASIYIHLNPERGGLVNSEEEYRWSSWNLYCGTSWPRSFVAWTHILRLLDEDIPAARIKYRRLVEQARAYKTKEALEHPRSIGRFDVWRQRRFPEAARGEVAQERLLPRGYSDDAELSCQLSRLKGKKRLNKPNDIQARKFAIKQLQSRGFSIPEIMDCLEISRRTIYTTLAS